MKTLVCFLLLSTTALSAELSTRELHRLAAYTAYLVAVSSEIGGGTPSKPDTPDNKPAGGVCSECNGVGKVGDGTVMFPCGACGGTGRATSSAAPDIRPGTPDSPPKAESESAPPAQEAAAEPQKPPEPEVQITDIKQSKWDWQGRGNPPVSFKRQHLIKTHDIDPDSANKMSDKELEALHNLLHNSEVRAAAPKAKSSSSSSCPSGNCPTSSSSSSSSSTTRYGLFGRRR